MENAFKRIAVLLFIVCSVAAMPVMAQQIKIGTKHTCLVLNVDGQKKLHQLYFGEQLNDANILSQIKQNRNQFYVSAGTDNLFEPAIQVTHANGDPSLDLRYISHESKQIAEGVIQTTINLKDPNYPFYLQLCFKAYQNEDVIAQWVEVNHKEKDKLTLNSIASSMLHFNAANYWLTQFHGDWANEMNMVSTQLSSGIKIIDSKLGTRAAMYQSPSFLLGINQKVQENQGQVIGGTLAWSGNFRLAFEIDELNGLRTIAGINPYASAYQLKPGQTFKTPEFLFSFSSEGTGQISRNFHDWARKYGLIDGSGNRYTLLNNWEATEFDFNEDKLIKLFDDAKDLGTDLFLLDDGWFANKYPRNSDRAGLGDWQENKSKLPHGLGYLVDEADKKGLKFGIWLEPEMVNPKSELYEKHPDWILKLPGREEHYYRQQLVLDLCNPQVQDFVYGIVDGMMTHNPGIAYIKWDCNRMMTNTWSPYLKSQQSNLYVDYVKGLYKVMERLRLKYPKLPIMLCSGGGGRVDYGALPYFTEFWPSDNTGALERIFIQWGYSYFFPSIATANHVTNWGKYPMKFRLDVAMAGKLGFDLVPQHLKPDELQLCKNALKTYKIIKPIIWQGDQYRLISPYDDDRAALLYVDKAKQKAIVFAYMLSYKNGQNYSRIRLKGLDVQKSYQVNEIGLPVGRKSGCADNGKTVSGEYLMNIGLAIPLERNFESAVFELNERPARNIGSVH